MTQANLDQFFEVVAQNPDMQHQLKTISSYTDFVQLVIDLGEENGFTLSRQEVEEATTETRRKRLGRELWSELPIADIDPELHQFYQVATQDQVMLQKLKAVDDNDALAQLVVELGREKGYEFTQERVKSAVLEAQRKHLEDEWSELSEEELEAVAGGCGGVRFTSPTCGIGCDWLRDKLGPKKR